jgi:hypothetical protein
MNVEAVGEYVGQLEFALRAQMHRIEEQQTRIEELLAENQRLLNSQVAVANGQATDTAVDTLIRIMTNPDIIMRRRIRACETIIGYRVPGAIVDACKQFLVSVYSNPSAAVDHQLEASDLMRRLESPKVSPQIVRLVHREPDDGRSPEEKRKQLATEMERRRLYIEAKSREIEAEMGMVPPATE